MNADTRGIAASQQGATGGGTDGLGDVEIAENASLRSQVVEIRGFETFRAKDPDIRVALIIGENDNEVGQRLGGAGSW